MTDAHAIDDRLQRRVMIAALFFVLGLATVFIALGASASAIGRTLGQYKEWFTMAGGALIALFGLHFLGLLRIPLLYREARINGGGGGGGVLSAYLMGLAFAFGWTPCVGPVLAAILFQAAQAESLMTGVALLAVYSAGLGLPFLLAAAFIKPFMRFMARFRRHMGKVEKAMGAMLLVVGVLFMTGGFAQLSAWLLDALPGLARIEEFARGSGGLDVSYVTAFLGGLLSFLSPCVLPLTPPYLAFLAGTTFDKLVEQKSG